MSGREGLSPCATLPSSPAADVDQGVGGRLTSDHNEVCACQRQPGAERGEPRGRGAAFTVSVVAERAGRLVERQARRSTRESSDRTSERRSAAQSCRR